MFTLAEITNKILNVKSSIGSTGFKVERFGSLDANSGEVFVYDNLQSGVTLDYLELATNSLSDVEFRIYIGSNRLAIMRPDGVTLDGLTAETLLNNSPGFFDVLEFNPSNNLYKFRLNVRELKCPNGLRISIMNKNQETNMRCGVYGFGRVL